MTSFRSPGCPKDPSRPGVVLGPRLRSKGLRAAGRDDTLGRSLPNFKDIARGEVGVGTDHVPPGQTRHGHETEVDSGEDCQSM